jgi:hypothetical protein
MTLRVTVKKYAGHLLGPAVTEITGRPAPPDLVNGAMLSQLESAVATEPGAAVWPLAQPGIRKSLAPGAAVTVSLPVELRGPGYLPRRGVVSVQVRNRALPRRAAEALFYSNAPEQVRRFGVLYRERLQREKPIRLLYHHQNRMPRAFYLALDLVNPGPQPVRLQVIEGAAKPIVDTVLVGHRAAARYIRRALRDEGTILEVPAGERRTVLVQRVAPAYTASGIYGLRLLDGPTLVVQVSAARQREAGPATVADLKSPASSEEVYPSPSRRLQVAYRVGGHWGFATVGGPASEKSRPQRQLDGEYGVFYDIRVEIENPTTEERTVNLILEPAAGAARGVFLVDGRLIELPNLVPPAEYVLASIAMKPSSRSRVTLCTLPAGGSAYPMTLVVRTRRPGEPRLPFLPERGQDRLTEAFEDEVAGD